MTSVLCSVPLIDTLLCHLGQVPGQGGFLLVRPTREGKVWLLAVRIKLPSHILSGHIYLLLLFMVGHFQITFKYIYIYIYI